MAPTAPPASAPRAPVPPAVQPTHGCVRCGAPVPLDVAMCENCNPLGLKEPAATQVHGTVALGLIVGIVILAVLARVAVSGVGPFRAQVSQVVPDPLGIRVTLAVTNDGSRAGTTTCRLFDPSLLGIGPESTYVTTQRIDPGQTAQVVQLVTTMGRAARPVGVDCAGR